MNTNETDILKQLFEDHFSEVAQEISAIEQSGSDRKYYRIKGSKHTAIGTYSPNAAENNSYFYFSKLFQKHEIKTPEIYKIGKNRKYYLQQDLGSISLFDLLKEKGFCDEVKDLYKKSLAQLARLQWIAGKEVDYNQCYGTKQFDENAIEADFQYFKYYFADLQKVVYNKIQFQDEIIELSKELGRLQPQTLMYRDFQSRNIMIFNNEPYFIDFQGCMQGAPHYDICSLLWQAKAQLPDKWKSDLLDSYFDTLHQLPVAKTDETYLRRGYPHFVLLRLIQVLGAYGFRGLIEKKPHFISSIAPALKNLNQFLEDNPLVPKYPELRKVLESISHTSNIKKYQQNTKINNPKLQISINSFSYKKGIPKDPTANGGGYVFDCRGILNPGRKEEYKTLSGLDSAVQNYLDTETQMPEFLEAVQNIISISIQDYIQRGFEHLQINFGCTGGQHRSVFASEKTAQFISKKFNIVATINHTNQKNWVK